MGGPALLKTCVNYCGAFLVRDVFISIDYRPSDEMKVRSSADALGMRAGLEFVERFTGLGYTATAGRSSLADVRARRIPAQGSMPKDLETSARRQ